VKGIVATSWAQDRIDIFYRSGAPMAHLLWSGAAPWVGGNSLGVWDNLGGIFTSAPSAVTTIVPMPVVINPGGNPSPSSPVARALEPTAETSEAVSPTESPIRKLPTRPTPMVNRIDVFGLGLDYALYQQTLWGGVPSTGWASLGGVFLSTPAAIAWGGARIDLFGVGTDRAMYHRTWNGQTWTADWDRLGGIFTSEASCVSWGANHLDVFARGSDFTLRHRAYDGANWLTSDWQNFGGSLGSPPVSVAWGPNRLDIFAIANDGTLIHKWWDGDIWNDWETLGPSTANATFVSTPAAVSWGPERLDVFVIGNDGILYHYWYASGAWAQPEALGDDITSAPAAIVTAPDTIHLIKPSATGALYHKTLNGAQWTPQGWEIAHGASGGGPVTIPTRYRFSVDLVKVDSPRAKSEDTDTAQASVTPGNWPTQSTTQAVGDLGGPSPAEAQTNLLNFTPVTVELSESVVFNYQVVNKDGPDVVSLATALTNTGKSLADQALKSIAKDLGQGLAVITSIEIAGTIAVPVIGSILALVETWLLGQLGGLVSGGCDGIVAVEQVVLLGRDLQLKTANGPYTVTTKHQGTPSGTLCFGNSLYEVTWSITRS
jgi:hypothetical protein